MKGKCKGLALITRCIGLMLALMMVLSVMPQMVFAEGEPESEPVSELKGEPTRKPLAKRTILLYDCGADLETGGGLATYNLEQVLRARFSEEEEIRFLVMTGGSKMWYLDKEYLYDPEADEDHQPVEISSEYNQIWEAKGLDASDNPGKMVLLDRDGITGNGDAAKPSKEELMSDPDTLKAFINFGVEYAPAEKYDLILWDHGGGPVSGFAVDEHQEITSFFDNYDLMSFSEIVDALAHNKVVDSDSDGEPDGKFDFVDFDACLMNSIELDIVLADYMDYYIASPETEPGYGQYYTGWLDMLGGAENHEVDTYTLGKKIVDDFYEFYDSGDGEGQEGTLAIIDTKKMLDPDLGLVDTLKSLSRVLKNEANGATTEGEVLFYDEINSLRGSIQYGDSNYWDLGNFASLLSVVNMEVTQDPENNPYREVGQEICRILQLDNDDPASFIYARGTDGITTDTQLYRKADGELDYDSQGTSGIYLYFPDMGETDDFLEYFEEIGKVIEMMPEDDPRREFLDDYRHTLIDYALISICGETVDLLLSMDEMDKADIDYEALKARWQLDIDNPDVAKFCEWNMKVKPLYDVREGGEREAEAWLRVIISQQVDEAIDGRDISAKRIKSKDGNAYEVTINGSKRRVIDSVRWNVNAEMPAFDEYIDKYIEDDMKPVLKTFGELSLGRIGGQEILSDMPDPEDPDYQQKLIDWYNKRTSVWQLDELKEKWYAIKDAEGKQHVAAYEFDEDDSSGIVPVTIGVGDQNQLMILEFEEGELAQVYFVDEDTGLRPVNLEDVKGELEVMPVMYISIFGVLKYYIPISSSTFTLSADNAGSISLVYEDVDDIADIADIDGDGKALNNDAEVVDFYGGSVDITDQIDNPEEELIDINYARIKPGIYTGEVLSPEVVYRDKVLEEGTDYELIIEDNVPEFRETGEYEVTLFGKGKYAGYTYRTFYIILSEEDMEDMIDQAEQDMQVAKEELEYAIEFNLDDVGRVYQTLVTAQTALAEAQEEFNRRQAALALYDQETLQEKIDELEERIKELTQELAQVSVVDISNYAVTMKTSFEYTGEEIEPEISVSGLTPSDYRVEYYDNVKIGTGTVIITGNKANKFKGTIMKTFKITKRTNTLKAKGNKTSVQYKKLKKRAQKLKASKVVKLKNKGQGKLTYKKLSGTKKITINKKNGKVTVKKGLKKGKYKIKIQVKAKGTSIYKSAVQIVTATVTVK